MLNEVRITEYVSAPRVSIIGAAGTEIRTLCLRKTAFVCGRVAQRHDASSNPVKPTQTTAEAPLAHMRQQSHTIVEQSRCGCETASCRESARAPNDKLLPPLYIVHVALCVRVCAPMCHLSACSSYAHRYIGATINECDAMNYIIHRAVRANERRTGKDGKGRKGRSVEIRPHPFIVTSSLHNLVCSVSNARSSTPTPPQTARCASHTFAPSAACKTNESESLCRSSGLWHTFRFGVSAHSRCVPRHIRHVEGFS